MSRLSREKKREQQQAAHAANLAAAPIDVRVPAGGTDAGGASVGGATVIAGPGEEIQQAVLNRLHRIAIASGHAVLATVHDERIGCVVPLRVDPDGSSHFTAQPVLTAPAREPGADRPTHLLRPLPGPAPEGTSGPAPVRDAALTFELRPVPGTEAPRDAVPTFEPRAVPGAERATPPGTVAPPTGEFGPPPAMDAKPRPGLLPAPEAAPSAGFALDPDPGPTPPRGFDAVAEAVLGDEPPAGENHLAEPMARINEAVRAGRLDTAARLAGETVAEASGTLGAEHPEVLRLRELAAYIAYLAGEPLRAFRISLDLAVICRRAGDAEAAYGNVRSAATAWRAVRDPLLGLELGHELIALWTQLTAEDGPAADEIEELESARARMGRLTERARTRQP
ncbi:tetratricopeptide repeat protein [Streptomyces sp. NPDC000348]|uniref:tetratricopeptide repeat protein n=1 Tax=Streptomyces sp. NPDC000348 TaxID=3364538 RepID=UPI00369CBE83